MAGGKNRKRGERKNSEQKDSIKDGQEKTEDELVQQRNKTCLRDETNNIEHQDSSKGEEEKTEKEVHQPSKKKRKEIFPYGNYKSYYGYRIGQELGEDPRLSVLKKEWFEGKDCLDIGCNTGIMTIQIAKTFRCQSILGVDIDSKLIGDAYWHLRKIIRRENPEKMCANNSGLKASDNLNGTWNSNTVASNEETKQISKSHSPVERDLLDVVSFRQENFVRSQHSYDKHYDTILCLSVTKWIHLNWGDDGLITLFSKIWRLLNPGGILVLEPQPWKSYENNRRVSETTSQNYKTIMIRPESFQDLLLDKIGFRKVEDMTSSLSGSKTGFNRPIIVFHK